jgi:hypothetical protein
MKKKLTYPIRNWSEYNATLKQWGSLTIWSGLRLNVRMSRRGWPMIVGQF